MGTAGIDTLVQKFELLPKGEQQKVFNFIESLLRKVKPGPKRTDKEKILLGMSRWDDEDIKQLDLVREHMNQWQPETF